MYIYKLTDAQLVLKLSSDPSTVVSTLKCLGSTWERWGQHGCNSSSISLEGAVWFSDEPDLRT